MGAQWVRQENRISVSVDGKLGYEIWQTLRDARLAALESNLPLYLDMKACRNADMGGIGEILIAQEKLRAIQFSGCSSLFFECFHAFGICEHCTEKRMGCPFCSDRADINA